MSVKRQAAAEAPSRKEREEALRREIILEAAEKVIGAKGFQGAGMEEIARAAQLSTGSLYNAFAGKDELYRVLFARRSERLLEHLRARLDPALPARRALETVIETLFEYFDANRNFFMFYLDAVSSFSWHIRRTLGEEAMQRYEQYIRTVADLFARGIAAGEIPAADPDHLAVAFMGGLNGFITQWAARDASGALTDLIPSAKATLLRLARTGV